MKEIAEKMARVCAQVEAQGLEVIYIGGDQSRASIQMAPPKAHGFEGVYVGRNGKYREWSTWIDGIRVFWLTQNEEQSNGN